MFNLQSLISNLLLLSIFTTGILGLILYFFSPAIAKDDMRGVAQYLEGVSTAEDLILIPDTDWSLPFEYHGQAQIEMPGLDSPQQVWDKLPGAGRVFVVDYKRGTRDWQEQVPFGMEAAGDLRSVTPFDGLLVREYQLSTPPTSLVLTAQDAQFGALQLLGSWVEPQPSSETAVTIALRWQQAQPNASNRYHVSLRLVDVDGWPLATVDDVLLDGNGRPSEQWDSPQTVTTYHVLPFQPNTPPLEYALNLTVYTKDDSGITPRALPFTLPSTRLTDAVEPGNPYQIPKLAPLRPALMIAPDLFLKGLSLSQKEILPGQQLIVQMVWQATSPLPDLRPKLILRQHGVDLVMAADAPALGRYPTHLWRAEEHVWEHRRLLIPPGTSGTATVVLELDSRQFELGQIEITETDQLFVEPTVTYPLDANFGGVARLIGVDLPAQLSLPTEKIPLTLYWEAVATGNVVDYTVFTHVLAEDGHLIAQHDGMPGNGRRPTRGWSSGEYVIDLHEMVIVDPDYRGLATVEIGLYDPQTGERLLIDGGQDFLLLPQQIEIR